MDLNSLFELGADDLLSIYAQKIIKWGEIGQKNDCTPISKVDLNLLCKIVLFVPGPGAEILQKISRMKKNVLFLMYNSIF